MAGVRASPAHVASLVRAPFVSRKGRGGSRLWVPACAGMTRKRGHDGKAGV